MKRIFQLAPETQCQVILHNHSPHSSNRGAFRPVSCSFVYLNPAQKSLSFKVMNCQGSLASKLQNRVQRFSSPETMQMSIWHCPSLGCSHRDLSFCVGEASINRQCHSGHCLEKAADERSPQNELCHCLFSDHHKDFQLHHVPLRSGEEPAFSIVPWLNVWFTRSVRIPTQSPTLAFPPLPIL